MATTGQIAYRLDRTLRAAGLAITGVSIRTAGDKTTWTVQPSNLQAEAQPLIDAFDPDDQGQVTADLDAAAQGYLDTERVFSALVWAILDTYSAPATIAKYQAARTKIVSAFKAQPWKA